jgi:hypothetical protein
MSSDRAIENSTDLQLSGAQLRCLALDPEVEDFTLKFYGPANQAAWPWRNSPAVGFYFQTSCLVSCRSFLAR